ncbi:MAG: sulfite exporter TauE/SafE family protein [Oligoflexales bacterium]|nr:sulfite exporter TauE/SafE family protein [Oligoflexales bacterium]
MELAHFSLEAVVAALAFGALHALEPGHGKTALLAYMADGSKSYSHSVVVGAASFFSHTVSILLISFIVHAATHFAGEVLNAQTVTWYVGFCSSLVLFGIGCFMMVQSYNRPRKKHACCKHHAHHDHDHNHGEKNLSTKKSKFSLSAILGVSVGLYPCPTAIAAYLTALTNGNHKTGYLAILVYGIGIGITMMLIGLTSGYMGRSLLSRFFNKKLNQALIIRAQSAIFMLIGIGQLFNIHH